MATSYINHTLNKSSAARGPEVSFLHTVPAGINRLLLVCVMCEGDESVNSITYAGNSLIKEKSVASGSNTGCAVEIWSLTYPPVGEATLVVNYASSVNPDAIAAVNFVNVNQEDPIGGTGSNYASSGQNVTCDITTQKNGSLVFGVATGHGGDTSPYTTQAGQTERWDDNTGADKNADAGLWGGDIFKGAAGQLTFNLTANVSDDWAIACVEIHSNIGWLSGWSKRIKITIDCTNIDSDQDWFPVTIFLGASVGQDPDDVTAIFDEVGAESKKIAVTKADGTTELYVEIEQWDSGSEVAVLHVSRDGWTITSASATEIYIYYDSSHADNDTYVGDTPGSSPVTSVWDSHFKGILHLRESGDGTANEFKDSTSNNNDGTGGSGDANRTPNQVDFKLGKGQDFIAASKCHIEIKDSVSLDFSGADGITLEYWANFDVWGNWVSPIAKGDMTSGNTDFQFATVTNGGAKELAWDGTLESWRTKYFDTSADVDTDIHLVLTHDNSDVEIHRDGAGLGSQADAGAIYHGTDDLAIGRNGAADSGYIDGTIDEVRISDMARIVAWIKATYYSTKDDLLSFGSEETSWTPKVIMVT